MLFTTPMCPVCNEIKDWLIETKKEDMVEKIDAATPEGKEKCQEFNVVKVPTMLSFDKDGNKAGAAYDLDEVEEMFENKNLSEFSE